MIQLVVFEQFDVIGITDKQINEVTNKQILK